MPHARRSAIFQAMRVSLDATFQLQRKQFAFVFSCEDCVYFDEARSRCAHGYPVAPHRTAAFTADASATAMFCKEFEVV